MSGAPTHPVVLFDGVCGLCDRMVGFLLPRDREGRLRFAALQSDVGQRLLRAHGLSTTALDTVVVIADGRAYVRSDAAVRVLRELPMPWRWAAGLRWVPQPIRDAVYDWISRNRYGWFGKRDTCRLPTPSERARFLE